MGSVRGTTGSRGVKHELDKFYTTTSTAALCINSLGDLSRFATIIEPSAGSGSFSHLISGCVAYDLHPEGEGITRTDWFEVEKSQFASPTLVVGNPPFGRNGSLAKRFLIESMSFAEEVAFILPKSFSKESMRRGLSPEFYLESTIPLPLDSFTLDGLPYHLPCIFQHWKRGESSAPLAPAFTEKSSEFMKIATRENADFRVQRVGGSAGKASTDTNRSPSSNYFFTNSSSIPTEELVGIINGLTFPTINDTVGPRSLPKPEFYTITNQELRKRS